MSGSMECRRAGQFGQPSVIRAASNTDEYRIVATRAHDGKTLIVPVDDYAAGQHWLASWAKGEDEGGIVTARLEYRTLTPWTPTAIGGAA